MYIIESEHFFDAAHFLKGYKGKCSNIHGHRWRVVARIASDHLSDEPQTRGMVMDFKDIKKALRMLTEEFDHTLIIEKSSLNPHTLQALLGEGFAVKEMDFRPTAEHFARYFYTRLRKTQVPVIEVSVYETPKNCASYREDL